MIHGCLDGDIERSGRMKIRLVCLILILLFAVSGCSNRQEEPANQEQEGKTAEVGQETGKPESRRKQEATYFLWW